MIGHPTMDKGNIGLAKILADMTVKGFTVLLPVYEQMPFDLVVYGDRQFCRVQVKYRSIDKTGAVQVSFKSCSVYTSGKKYSKPMDKNEVDLIAIYCPETDECYYLNPRDFKGSVQLRIKVPGNGQRKGIHLAEEYLQPKPW